MGTASPIEAWKVELRNQGYKPIQEKGFGPSTLVASMSLLTDLREAHEALSDMRETLDLMGYYDGAKKRKTSVYIVTVFHKAMADLVQYRKTALYKR